jgi:hypothetical protein
VHDHRGAREVTASQGYFVIEEPSPMIKAIVFAALAACGVSPTPATAAPPAEHPDEFEPNEMKPKESHWCCQAVDPKTKSGDGCSAFSGSIEVINQCAEYLHCPDGATKHDGKVTCF